MADLRGRSVRGGAVTLSAQALKFLLQVGSTAVLARLLTPADFGLIAMVAAFIGFVSLFKDLGLSMATVQRSEITHAQVSALFWINVLLSVVLSAVAAAFAPAVAWFYGEPRLTSIMLAVAATFIFGGISAQHVALLQRQMRFRALASVELTALAFGIVVAITLAAAGCGYWALVLMGATAAFTTMVLSWSLSGWRPSTPHRTRDIWPLLRYGGNLTGYSILNFLNRNLDGVLIGWSLGSVSVGLYSKAYGLLTLPINQINAPISAVVVPALSRLQRDHERYRRYYLQALQAMVMIGMPVVAFALADAEQIVRLLLGERWLSAVEIFRWLGPAAFVGTFNVAAGWVFVSTGRADKLVRWGLVSMPVTVCGLLLGLQWGVLGVAAAFSVTYCTLQFPMIAYAYSGSPIRLRDLGGVLWRPASIAIAAACSVVVFAKVSPISGMSLVCQLLLDLLVYGVAFIGCACVVPGGMMLVRHTYRNLKGTLQTVQHSE